MAEKLFTALEVVSIIKGLGYNLNNNRLDKIAKALTKKKQLKYVRNIYLRQFTESDLEMIKGVYDTHLKSIAGNPNVTYLDSTSKYLFEHPSKDRRKDVSKSEKNYDLTRRKHEKVKQTRTNITKTKSKKHAGTPIPKEFSEGYTNAKSVSNSDTNKDGKRFTRSNVKRSLKRSINPFTEVKDLFSGLGKKGRVIAWTTVTLVSFILVGGVYVSLMHSNPVAVNSEFTKVYKNKSDYKNFTVNGTYKVRGREYAVVTYTNDKGWFASTFDRNEKKIVKTSAINPEMRADNPIVVLEFINSAFRESDGKQKPIMSLDADEKTVTVNGVEYFLNQSLGQVYGYHTAGEDDNTTLKKYDNQLLRQHGQQEAFKKLKIDTDKVSIVNLNFDKNKKEAVVYVMDKDGNIYSSVTKLDGKVNVYKIQSGD